MVTFKQTFIAVLSAAALLIGVMDANAAGKSASKMYCLVEMDHVKSGAVPTKETRREFIEGIILPTLALAEQYTTEGKIVAGGPVVGRIALRFIVEADSPQEVDRLIESLPLWRLAEPRVTPLIAFSDRRANVQIQLNNLTTTASDNPADRK
jgi:hypothetical protein